MFVDLATTKTHAREVFFYEQVEGQNMDTLGKLVPIRGIKKPNLQLTCNLSRFLTSVYCRFGGTINRVPSAAGLTPESLLAVEKRREKAVTAA